MTGPRCISLGLVPLGGVISEVIFFGGIAGTAKVAVGPLLATGSLGIGALANGALASGALGLCVIFFFGVGGGTALVL